MLQLWLLQYEMNLKNASIEQIVVEAQLLGQPGKHQSQNSSQVLRFWLFHCRINSLSI